MKLKTLLAICSALGFVVFHFLTDFHYRPNADDFAGMFYASQGLPGIGYASRFYMEWEGPFLSMIVQGLWMRALFLGVPGGIIISVIKVIMLISSVYMFNGIIQLFSGKKDLITSVISGAVSTTTLYLISSSQEEIWHWVMGTVVYIHPLVFLQLTIGLLCRRKFALAVFPMAYIMQSRATYAVLFYGLITLLVIYAWAKNTKWKKQATVANLILLIAFLIYLFAPGNANRMSPEGFDMAHYIHEYRKEVRSILMSFNIAKIDRIMIGLIAFVPFIPASGYLKFKTMKYWVVLPGLAYILFVLVHGIIFVYATGYAAWYRVFSMHTFLFFLVCLFYCYVGLNNWLNEELRNKLKRYLAPLAMALLFFKLYFPLGDQLKAGKSFAEAYDDRNTMIFSFQGAPSDTLFISALPKPGVLHYWEFSENAGFWINDDFRMRYDIEYQIALRPAE